MTRWYRSHVGLVTDAKLGEAALIAECSRALAIAVWHAVLESCAETNDAGRYETTPRRVAAILAEPIAKVEGVFAALADLGMVEAGRVKAWSRRQFESDSSTERSRKHREAKRSGEAMRGHSVSIGSSDCEPPNETPVQRCATPPYSYPDTEDNPSSPSLEAARDGSRHGAANLPNGQAGDSFELFWQAMPTPNPAAKAAALAGFARLSPQDQAKAIAAARRYASGFAAKPTTHPISPTRFLRERCFDGYGPQGNAAAGGEAASVFVRVESPQWRAWAAYRGKPIPINGRGDGWHFPSEWPPETQPSAA